MSSVVKADGTGEQICLDRSNWFSAEAVRLLEQSVADPTIGPERTLSMILHHGLGVPLSLVGRLIGTTKNVVAKQVISGRQRMRRTFRRPQLGERSLF